MTKLSQEISLQQFVLLITYLLSWLFGGVWLSKDFSSFFLFQISHSKNFCVSFLPRCIWYLSGSSLASIIYYSYSESTFRLIFLSFKSQGRLSLVKLPWLSGDCLEIHHIEIVVLLRYMSCSLLALKREASLLLEKRSNICVWRQLYIKGNFKQKSYELISIKIRTRKRYFAGH